MTYGKEQDFNVDKEYYQDQYNQGSPERFQDDPLSLSMKQGVANQPYEKNSEFDTNLREDELNYMKQGS